MFLNASTALRLYKQIVSNKYVIFILSSYTNNKFALKIRIKKINYIDKWF